MPFPRQSFSDMGPTLSVDGLMGARWGLVPCKLYNLKKKKVKKKLSANLKVFYKFSIAKMLKMSKHFTKNLKFAHKAWLSVPDRVLGVFQKADLLGFHTERK